MTDAERMLKDDLERLKKERAELQAQVTGIPPGGTKSQRARAYWQRRIQQAQEEMKQIESKLKAG